MIQDNTFYKVTYTTEYGSGSIYYKSKEDYDQFVSDCKKVEYKTDLQFYYNMTEEEAESYYKNHNNLLK